MDINISRGKVLGQTWRGSSHQSDRDAVLLEQSLHTQKELQNMVEEQAGHVFRQVPAGSTESASLGRGYPLRDCKTPLFILAEYTENRLTKFWFRFPGPWAHYLTILNICFFICKIGK